MVEQVMAYLETPWLQPWVPWVIFAGYLAATWVVVWLARSLLRGILARAGAGRGSLLAEQLMRTAVGPLRFLIWTTGLFAGLQALGNRVPILSQAALLGGEFGVLVRIVGSLMIVAVAALVNVVMKGSMDLYVQQRAAGNGAAWNELVPAGRRVLSLLLYFIAASIILRSQFNQDITALVTTAGVASLAIALAAQETLSNMLGGFVILVDRPFRVGDAIELTDGKGGEVAEIGLRSTRITQYDGTALVVPNKDMANSRIVNMAQPEAKAAIRQSIGVGYGTDIEQAKQVLLDVLEGHPEVLQEPAPGVWFTRFNATSLELFMSAWVASYKDRFRVADELNIRILEAFREAGIDIPHSQPVVLASPPGKQR